jgi:hypothetical protein
MSSFFNCRIRALSESVEVLRDLYRTSGWAQQMEHQWMAAEEGCFPAAEEFLEPGGDHGNIPGFVVKGWLGEASAMRLGGQRILQSPVMVIIHQLMVILHQIFTA